MNASDPPLILTRTSPGPAVPRVATVMTPMHPMADTFATTPLLKPRLASMTSVAPPGSSRTMEYTRAGRRCKPRRCDVSPGPHILPSWNTVRLEPPSAFRREATAHRPQARPRGRPLPGALSYLPKLARAGHRPPDPGQGTGGPVRN